MACKIGLLFSYFQHIDVFIAFYFNGSISHCLWISFITLRTKLIVSLLLQAKWLGLDKFKLVAWIHNEIGD